MSNIYDLDKWNKWAENNTRILGKIKPNGKLGIIDGMDSDELLKFTIIDKDNINLEVIEKIDSDEPLIDLLLDIPNQYYDEIFEEGKFKTISSLLKDGTAVGYNMYSEDELFEKGFTFFMSFIGITFKNTRVCKLGKTC